MDFLYVGSRTDGRDTFFCVACNGQQKPDTYSGSVSIQFPLEFERVSTAPVYELVFLVARLLP